MELHYIRVCGVNYFPRPKGVQKRDCYEGVFEPYCIITQMSKGRFKIEYENYFNEELVLIAYPSGIQEIEYKNKKNYE